MDVVVPNKPVICTVKLIYMHVMEASAHSTAHRASPPLTQKTNTFKSGITTPMPLRLGYIENQTTIQTSIFRPSIINQYYNQNVIISARQLHE